MHHNARSLFGVRIPFLTTSNYVKSNPEPGFSCETVVRSGIWPVLRVRVRLEYASTYYSVVRAYTIFSILKIPLALCWTPAVTWIGYIRSLTSLLNDSRIQFSVFMAGGGIKELPVWVTGRLFTCSKLRSGLSGGRSAELFTMVRSMYSSWTY